MPFKSSLAAILILTFVIGCGRGASSNVPSIDEPTPESDTVEIAAKTDESTSNDESASAKDDKDATNKDTAAPDTKKPNNSNNKTASKSHHENALSMPPKAIVDADATEMVRAWVVDQQLVCTLRPEIWEAPGTWGVLLADVAYQIANANAELRGIPANDTLADIAASFNKEMPNSKASAAPLNDAADPSASVAPEKEATKKRTDTPKSDESAVSSKSNAPDAPDAPDEADEADEADSETDTTDTPTSKEKPDAERDK